MVEGCTTLQINMKANNVIVTMQTNGGGKGKRKPGTPKTTTMPFRQQHTISFKIFFLNFQFSPCTSTYFNLSQIHSESWCSLRFDPWSKPNRSLHTRSIFYSILRLSMYTISINLTLKITSFNFTLIELKSVPQYQHFLHFHP